MKVGKCNGRHRLMHLSQVRLMVEVFNLRTNELLGQGCSQPICDSSSKVKFPPAKNQSFLCFSRFPPKRSTALWSSTQPFPCAAVPREAARCYFPYTYISPHPVFTLFSARCSWCVTAPWPRTWSPGSRSTTKEGIWRIKTIFSSSQGWQAGNRWRRFPFS